MRKAAVLLLFLFLMCVPVFSNDQGSEDDPGVDLTGKIGFNLVFSNVISPDYFRFVDSAGNEIGSEGIGFSMPDPVTKIATADVYVRYRMHSSGLVLTLHRTSTMDSNSSISGYMMEDEDPATDYGLNYDLYWGDGFASGKQVPEEKRAERISLSAYDLVIYYDGSTKLGTPEEVGGNQTGYYMLPLRLQMNPVTDTGSLAAEDGSDMTDSDNVGYYMDGIYYGYLTLSLTSL